MANHDPIQTIPGLVAGADLSAKQYHFIVGGAADRAVVAAGANAIALGVLQNAPALGQTAVVGRNGNTKLQAGAAFARFVPLTSDANGAAVVATTGQRYNAIALEAAGAAGDIVSAVTAEGVAA